MVSNQLGRPFADNGRAALIAAAFTPMHGDGSLNLEQVRPIVDHLIASGISGAYVCGSTGEGVSLTGEERKRVAAAYSEAAAGRLPVIVQVGHNSVNEARELAAHAQRTGADAISATSPSYFKPHSPGVLVDCMAEIASGAPDVPFYYYHIPSLTYAEMDVPGFLKTAANRIPSFAGIKYTAPTLHEFQVCLNGAHSKLSAFWGVDEMLLAALAVGAPGAIGSTYNFAAPLYHKIIDCFEQGDLGAARGHQERAIQMVRVFGRYRAAPAIKATMKLIGLDCGPSRLPLETLSSRELEAMRQELDQIGFFQWGRPAVASTGSAPIVS